MNNSSIILLSCGHFEKAVIDQLANDIHNKFQVVVSTKLCQINMESFYNPTRRQYDANMVLKAVEELNTLPQSKIIGLFRVDLYIPILTYIFGQAKLGGNSGVASLYRLKNELYGLDPNPTLLIERFKKVLMHELGHMFGLIHCSNPICIMRSSTYAEDVDQKEDNFCPTCKKLML